MSTQVTIPFQDYWQDKMLSGNKTCTSRTKRYGNPTDIFQQFGATFRILAVSKLPLESIATTLYKQEGCDSPDEFKGIWVKLHPRKGWVPDQEVFVHFFKKEA